MGTRQSTAGLSFFVQQKQNMSEQLTDLEKKVTAFDKRITTLETSMPLMVGKIEDGLRDLQKEVHEGFSSLRDHMTAFALQNRDVEALKREIAEVKQVGKDHAKEDDEFHKEVSKLLWLMKLVGGGVSIAWAIFQFIIPLIWK